MLDGVHHLVVKDLVDIRPDLTDTPGRSNLAIKFSTSTNKLLHLLLHLTVTTASHTGFHLLNLGIILLLNHLILLTGNLLLTVILVQCDGFRISIIVGILADCTDTNLYIFQLRIGTEDIGRVNDIGKDGIVVNEHRLDGRITDLIAPFAVSTLFPASEHLNLGGIHAAFRKFLGILQQVRKHREGGTGNVPCSTLTNEMVAGNTM